MQQNDKLTGQRSVRLPQWLEERLGDFCASTIRTRADVIRAAVAILLADGHEQADERLKQHAQRQRPEAAEILAGTERRGRRRKKPKTG